MPMSFSAIGPPCAAFRSKKPRAADAACRARAILRIASGAAAAL
jgi:hypothetical protein